MKVFRIRIKKKDLARIKKTFRKALQKSLWNRMPMDVPLIQQHPGCQCHVRGSHGLEALGMLTPEDVLDLKRPYRLIGEVAEVRMPPTWTKEQLKYNPLI